MANTRSESGSNLNGWNISVGDGIYNAPEVDPVNLSDIPTEDQTSESILKANVLKRRIMAHNITFKRIIDPSALTHKHTATFKFKIPYTISTSNTDFNGQTVEGGFFVWDGETSELDYGLAFQWVINPHDPYYKALNFWNGNGWSPLNVVLEPNTEFNLVEFNLDIPNNNASLKINNILFNENVFSETPKTGFSSTVDARLQTETISIYPPVTGNVPSHEVLIKDWTWNSWTQ